MAMEAPVSDNLYMTNLPPNTTDSIIAEAFAMYGVVTQCKVWNNSNVGDRGAALVRFQSVEEAQSIVMSMNGATPLGFDAPVHIKFAINKSSAGANTSSQGSYGKWPEEPRSRTSPFTPAVPAAAASPAAFVSPEAFAAAGAAAEQQGRPDGSSTGSWVNTGAGPNRGASYAEPPPGDNLYIKGLPLGTDDSWLMEALSGLGVVTSVKVLTSRYDDGSVAALARFDSMADAMHVKNMLHGQTPEWCSAPLVVRYANPQNNPKGGQGKGGGGGGGGGGAPAAWGSTGGYGNGEEPLPTQEGDSMKVDVACLVKMVQEAQVLPGSGKYRNSDTTIYIAGLPGDTTDKQIYQLFSPFGAIITVFVKIGFTSNDSWAIAFVNYADLMSAQAAIATYHGMQLPDGSVLKVQIKTQK